MLPPTATTLIGRPAVRIAVESVQRIYVMLSREKSGGALRKTALGISFEKAGLVLYAFFKLCTLSIVSCFLITQA